MRNPDIYLEDILKSIKNVNKYTKNFTFKDFKKNNLVVDAVIRNLEVIGEAAKNVSTDIKNRYSDVEWKKISGLRNVLIHEYFGVDLEILWDIVKNKLPILKKHIACIKKELY